MRSFHLSENEMNEILEHHETPFFVVSTGKIAENYNFLRKHLPHAGVYYAMKANPEPAILETLAGLGSCFDVASAGEIEALAMLGIDGSRMIYANTVKDARGLAAARAYGVKRMTFDDESEIAKIAAYVPDAEVLVRIAVHNKRALVDLNTKFGAHPEDAIPLLQKAKAAGLNPVGICFHVGSQSLSTAAYEEALLFVHGLFDEAKAAGLALTDLDIGGGFPVPDMDGLAVDVAAMMETIDRQIVRLFPETAVYCEPGRFIPGTAANFVASVIGTKDRDGHPWYILDDGIYGAFTGLLFDHWHYPLFTFADGPVERATIAGPTCDGIDVIAEDYETPRLTIGDHVLATDIGAYTSVSATRFNGFDIAPTYIYEEECAAKGEEQDLRMAAHS
ncbi:type III PLP-dependent enzyme [Selenomonas sp.]|uniref:type III PLP-dependent enzyme n=1 Tax=Selenomonas sp. TaxID=2053611 RepID=UPI002A755AD8|nr:type III PLP-dependent enzyme [Selenomonas sp.]MDY3298204.1 type III PLP-dependent enzyme [Selenomonas sp.]